MDLSIVMPERAASTRYWNNLEDSWHRAGVLLAVNAIGTELRDLINPGLIR